MTEEPAEDPTPQLLLAMEDLDRRLTALERGPQRAQPTVHYVRLPWPRTACGMRIRDIDTGDPQEVTCDSCKRTVLWKSDSGHLPPVGSICTCDRHPYPAKVCVTLGNTRRGPE